MKAHQFMHEMTTNSSIFGRNNDVRVVFEGEEAKTDGNTIFLPALPQDADLSHELVQLMRGYVDHEAGHHRHSDISTVLDYYDRWSNNGKPDLCNLHNLIEDQWMEGKVVQEYPGAWRNLRQTSLHVTKQNTENLKAAVEAGGGDLTKALTPAQLAQALVGYSDDSYGTSPEREEALSFFSDEQKALGKHWSELARQCNTSQEAVDLAKAIYKHIEQDPQCTAKPEDFDEDATGMADGGNSEEFKRGQAKMKPGQGKAGPMDRSAGTTTEGEADEYNDGRAPTEGADDFTVGGGIGDMVGTFTDKHYRAFSTDQDVVNSKAHHRSEEGDFWRDVDPSEYIEIKGTVRSNVNVMKNKLRRSLMAKDQRNWDFGRELGRLDSKRLVSAYQGSPTVFKQREDREELDTAVILLVDLSGSMCGSKTTTSTQCLVALSECFEGTFIKYQIQGFHNSYVYSERYHSYSGEGRYHRYEPAVTEVFKAFDQSLRTARPQIAGLKYKVGGNNSDYDFVAAALAELMVRPERRKVLFTLSDGYPACESDAPYTEHTRHIKECVQGYHKKGVECVGIGIKSDAVRKIYPDYAVVNDVNELSSTVFGKLTGILLANKEK